MRKGFPVLVLDGHSAAAVECVQSLGRRGAAVHVAAATADCIAFRSRYPAARLAQPPHLPLAAARRWLERVYRDGAYRLVVPSTDASLALLESFDERSGLRRSAVLPGNAALAVARDKELTRRLAERLGIPVPPSVLIQRDGPVPGCERYPAVLKAVHSRVAMGGRDVRMEAAVVMNAAEREKVLARWLPCTAVQQQQFVAGHGFGVEMLFDRGRKLWHFVHERLHELPLTGGASTYRRSIAPPPRMLEAAEAILSALGWHGAAMVELRGVSESDWHLMEINPRLWGSLALAIDSGVDFPHGLALLAAGEPVPPQPEYRVGYYTRQAHYDATWFKLNARAPARDPMLLTRPRLRSFAELARVLIGRESWDHFDWRDPGVMAAVVRTAASRELERALARWRRLRERWSAPRRHRRIVRRLARSESPPRVLFLCHGNICRSPVAEALARRRAIGCTSVGFHHAAGRTPPTHVMRAAASLGIELSGHRSRRISAADVERADLIVCMDLENLLHLRAQFPQAIERATLLGLFAPAPVLEIADPYGLDGNAALGVLRSIAACIDALRARLARPAAHGFSARERLHGFPARAARDTHRMLKTAVILAAASLLGAAALDALAGEDSTQRFRRQGPACCEVARGPSCCATSAATPGRLPPGQRAALPRVEWGTVFSKGVP